MSKFRSSLFLFCFLYNIINYNVKCFPGCIAHFCCRIANVLAVYDLWIYRQFTEKADASFSCKFSTTTALKDVMDRATIWADKTTHVFNDAKDI